ncbi:MAG: hypothetical protein U0Z17_01620 [Bacteroidales bacterium]
MKIKFLIPLSLIGLMFSCSSSTKLEKSWADPSFNSSMAPFTKVLVIAPCAIRIRSALLRIKL